MIDSHHIILRLRDEAKRKHAAALDRVAKARHEAEKYAVEMEAYNKALQAMDGADKEESAPRPAATANPTRSNMSDKWAGIYRELYKNASPPYSYDDIETAVTLAGHNASGGGQRSQMMNAVKSGWFERVDIGKFKFTESGLTLIGVDPNENSGTAVSEEAKSEDAASIFGFQNPNSALRGA